MGTRWPLFLWASGYTDKRLETIQLHTHALTHTQLGRGKAICSLGN